MTEKPLVSVIINCYNSEKYLRETIDSLIAQTYDNWEAIFWDNCSTDKTAEIIASYNEPRFRYFLAEKNTPLGEARNLAKEKVQGVYFCFLDSDDVWLPEFLMTGVMALQGDDKLVGFYSNYYIWKNDIKAPYNKNLHSGKHSFKTILKTYGIGMSACIVKHSIVKEYGISFDNRYQLIEDLDFFLKVSYYGDFYYDEICLCLYRVHSSSSSCQLKEKWISEYGTIYDELFERYVDVNNSILTTKDLKKLKYYKIDRQVSFFKENNRRKELFKLLIMNNSFLLKKPENLLFVFVGQTIYSWVKKKFRN